MIPAMAVTVVLVAVCVLVHYEVLRLASDWLPRITLPPRPRILFAVGAAFLAHTVEVWVFAVAYYVLGDHAGLGTLVGDRDHTFPEFLYFSTVTYTSLGFGDVYPIGGLRLVAGVESLLGLVMIGWSGSFTYLAMQRFWELHALGRKRV